MPAEPSVSTNYGTNRTSRPGVPGQVAALADRQWGVVALRQLEQLGMAPSTVRSWVASRRLVALHRGVYAVGHARLRREGRWLAAVLACGDDAFLSHRSAGALWGIAQTSASRIDVTARTQAGRRRSGIRVHVSDLSPDDVCSRSGIRCTSAARTLLDLAALKPGRSLERACEEAERQGSFDVWAIAGVLARNRGRRGVARLRTVLAEWDPDIAATRSELEARFLRAIVRAQLPRPVVNGRIALAGSYRPEVDFHWPAHRLVVETDGDAFHRSPRARREDSRRDQALRDAGWIVLRFSWADVVEHVERTVTLVRQALAAPPQCRDVQSVA